MLKITFYPNDEARIIGSHTRDNETLKTDRVTDHQTANLIGLCLSEQSRDGTIEAQIVTIRKHGAYTIPKLDRVNDVFNQLT